MHEQFEKWVRSLSDHDLVDLRRAKNGDEGYMSFTTAIAFKAFCDAYEEAYDAGYWEGFEGGAIDARTIRTVV